MKRTGIRLQDRLMAETLSRGSAVVQRHPGLAGIAGQTPGIRWQFMSGTSAHEIKWWKFSGNDISGRLPVHYVGAVVLKFPKEPLDEYLKAHEGSKLAYAYRLGETAVMAGVATDENTTLFADDRDSHDRYAMAGRVGSGVLRAAVGVVVSESRRFVVPDGLETLTAERMSVSEVSVLVPVW